MKTRCEGREIRESGDRETADVKVMGLPKKANLQPVLNVNLLDSTRRFAMIN